MSTSSFSGFRTFFFRSCLISTPEMLLLRVGRGQPYSDTGQGNESGARAPGEEGLRGIECYISLGKLPRIPVDAVPSAGTQAAVTLFRFAFMT
jgi:hypothetical protein